MLKRLWKIGGIGIATFFLALPIPFPKINTTRQESVEIPAYIVSAPQIDLRIGALDAFFQKHKCPYSDAAEYLKVADIENLDYRLLPAISVLEEECGKHNPVNNLFGYYGNGLYGLHPFKTIAEGVEYVGHQLNVNKLYAGKTLKQKLHIYNSVNPNYYNQIINLMSQIAK